MWLTMARNTILDSNLFMVFEFCMTVVFFTNPYSGFWGCERIEYRFGVTGFYVVKNKHDDPWENGRPMFHHFFLWGFR